jgi:uncharacterized protein YcnI
MIKRVMVSVVAAGALAFPAVTQAHISLHPNTVPAGAFVTLDVRVPGEVAGAYAYKVDMLMPPGFTDVDTQNVPGWKVTEVIKKLAKPIQTDDGPVNMEVSQVVWTGDRTSLGRLDNGTFIQFPLSIAMPDNIAGQSLGFKTLEYYSNGSVARGIGPASANYPTPTINVTAKGGVIQDVAGGEAGPAPGQVPSSTAAPASAPTAKPSGGASKGLAYAALAIGIIGTLLGAGGLAMARRRA